MLTHINIGGMVIVLLCMLHFTLYAQQGQKPMVFEELMLKTPSGPLQKNLIQFYMTEQQYENISASKGIKLELKEEEVFFNGKALQIKSAHLRGNTSLYLPRKSYSVSLSHKHTFLTKRLKDFYLISLSMDRNYFHNHLAFDLMQQVQLQGLFYSYTEVKINDHSQGIYMLVQRPQDYALHDAHAPMIMRRGYKQQVDKYKADKQVSKDSVRTISKQFRQIYKLCRKYEGEALYERLSLILDVRMYMQWMAFNYLVKNSDYTDEVYFYINPDADSGIFEIIPWDYDDIFRPYPHEGKEHINAAIQDKIIFSGEDLLDLTIARDTVLYKVYLRNFKQLLAQLSDSLVRQTFEQTYQDLYPYFTDQEVIAQSERDVSGQTDISALESELRTVYASMIYTRSACLQEIERMAMTH